MDDGGRVIQRKLSVLQCPFICDVQFSDPLSLHKLLCWLEDTHIRRYVPSDRQSLRKATFDLSAYCRDLSLPPPTDIASAIPYLLDTAISLHYSDCSAVYNVPVDPWAGRTVPVTPGSAARRDLITAARAVLSKLSINLGNLDNLHDLQDLDAGDLLSVIADILEIRPEDPADSPHRLSLGFTSGDPTVDRLSTAIRLLHVRDLRTLQHCINDAIAGMQAVTANPKTDSKLGRVGH